MTTTGAFTATELEAWPPSAETRKCPFPYYDSVREASPIYRYPQPHPTGRPIFLVTGWKECQYVLSHPEEFDSGLSSVLPELAGLVVLPYPEVPSFHAPEGVGFTVGADHDVKRDWTTMLFEADRMASYRGVISEAVDRLIDGFIDRGECDFTNEFAEALPLDVLTTIMGMPTEDAEMVKHLTDIITRLGMQTDPSDADVAAGMAAMKESDDYALRQFQSRLAEPRDDYLSDLLKAQIEQDGAFDQNAMVVHLRSMFLAAYHTTAAALASAMVHLCQNPELQQQIRDDGSLFRRFFEESIRLESPLQWHPRRCVRATVIGDVSVPEGAVLFVSFGAANRDESKYPEPDKLVVNRPQIMHHLGFGMGEHRCPGAPLARLYAEISFERLLARLKNIRLDEAASELEPLPGFNFRIPTTVAIQFDA